MTSQDDLGVSAQSSIGLGWRAVVARVVGHPDKVSLEHRLLNGMLLLGALTGVLASLINVAIGASAIMMVSTVTLTVAGLSSYAASVRSRAWRSLLGPVYAVFLTILIFSWVTQAGTNGTIGYYFFLLVSFVAVLLRGTWRVVALALTALSLATLLILEFISPATIVPYPTPLQRFADVAFALPLCLTISVALSMLIYREYQRERRANERLLRMVTAEKEQVERAMREKQRLLTMVCHDIANALTVVSGEISLVQALRPPQPLPPGAGISSNTLQRMDYACGNINEIISSVREMEAVEQGRLLLRLEAADLRAVFRNAQVIFAERLARKRVELRLPSLTPETRFVRAEPRMLANHVFANLISNAIKFSHAGSIIEVTISRRGQETIVSVIDGGIGIPAELLAKLFDLEAKTSRRGTDGERGTGFGMRTVKYFVELFGGNLEVESRSEDQHPTDHGTTVRVRLTSAPPLESGERMAERVASPGSV